MRVDEIYNKTRGLSPLDKSKLVDMILLDLDSVDSSVENAWVKEISMRKRALKTGAAKTLSYQQVMGKYK